MGGERRRSEMRGCGEDRSGLAQANIGEHRPSLANG